MTILHSGRSRSRAPRPLGLLPLAVILFFIVSGGPYGLEVLVGESGPGVALALIVVTPLIWSVPVALVTAELSSMMPVDGGYYAWVKKGLGPFWGFLEGWWSWIASFVDMAIYPVLFATYFAALLEGAGIATLGDDPFARWLIALAVIWPFTLLNIRGARPVGLTSIGFAVVVLAPFAVVIALGFGRLFAGGEEVSSNLTAQPDSLLEALGIGLFIVLWNYAGWDSISTIGGEISQPKRTVPLALAIVVPAVTLVYLLPVVAGLIASPDPDAWTEGSWPQIATALGGDALGLAVAAGGMVSAAALFSANLLAVSRVPFAMAADGYLPAAVARTHQRYGTPWVSILTCALVYSVISYGGFAALVVADVVLYTASILLELAALVALRARLPHARRPFAIPGGWVGIALVVTAPAVLLVVASVATLIGDGAAALYPSIAGLLSGVVAYPVARLLFKRGRPDVYVPLAGEDSAQEWRLLKLPALVPTRSPSWR